MRRSLLIAILLAACLLARGGRAAGASAGAEALAPAPSPAVQTLLEKAAQQRDAGTAAEVLASAEQALAAAQQTQDAAGEAQAQQERAQALGDLHREAEALAAWRVAEEAWQRAGDGPGQVAALAGQALVRAAGAPQETQRLLEAVLARARSEAVRPLGAAHAMHTGGSTIPSPGKRPPKPRCGGGWARRMWSTWRHTVTWTSPARWLPACCWPSRPWNRRPGKRGTTVSCRPGKSRAS